MAFWLCRLDSQASPSPNGPSPEDCGIQGWLLEADLCPDGLRPGANWDLYQRCGAGLPFGLDCRLSNPFTPAQERQLAAVLAPWLLREQSLRLQARPVLLLRGAQHFSHPSFGPKGLRLALNTALRRLGCNQPVLLLCWQNDPVQGADGLIDQPWHPAADTESTWNYEVFLRDAHHRPYPTGVWRIPAVLAPADPAHSPYLQATAELYQEWLALESAWSEFWLQGSPQAPVVLGSWPGHQRWWQAPHEARQQPPTQLPEPTQPQVVETGWGTLRSSHLALLVHGFHLPVLQRLLERLSPGGASEGLPELDLYLTVPQDHIQAAVALLEQLNWPRLRLFGVTNRGRDLAPTLLHALPAALATGHQQFVKVHTKASSHLHDGQGWGDHLINSLLCHTFLNQLSPLLATDPKLGLVAPCGTLLPCTLSLGQNSRQLLWLCQHYGIQPRSLLASRFIAGSMMAGRLEALRPLLQVPLPLEAFEAEAGQTDGTLAHALERWIAVLALRDGWRIHEQPGNRAAVPKFGYGWAVHPAGR